LIIKVKNLRLLIQGLAFTSRSISCATKSRTSLTHSPRKLQTLAVLFVSKLLKLSWAEQSIKYLHLRTSSCLSKLPSGSAQSQVKS